MPAPILIVGQGLAGTVLGWTLEREGVDFEMVDQGHARAASRVGAGIINPITGQRIVKSWRVDECLPVARTFYRELEQALGCTLVTEMRVRRLFRDQREREIFAEKFPRGDLAPYVHEGDADGFWIEQAMRVDLLALVSAARKRWLGQGRLREQTFSVGAATNSYDLIILCVGAEQDLLESFPFAGFKRVKGEILGLKLSRGTMVPGVIFNRGHWLLPIDPQTLKVGAAYDPKATDLEPTQAAREELAASARTLLTAERPFEILDQQVGWRMTTTDRQPAIGRAPNAAHFGLVNGLGSKGALYAPLLARQWFNHLTEGIGFDRTLDVARFER